MNKAYYPDDTAAYTGPHQVTLDRWISCAPFEALLGIIIEEAQEGKACLTMPFTEKLAQGAGMMHGGAIVTLADTAVAMAIKSRVPEGGRFGTISLQTEFLKPVLQGVLTARASVVFEKDRSIAASADVFNDENQVVMTFSARFKLAWDTKIPEQ
jgi:acyl-CoA thioesterase